jgi:hypothetical protein
MNKALVAINNASSKQLKSAVMWGEFFHSGEARQH